MHIHVGGYKCSPEQIDAWFEERGVKLQEGIRTVLGNRYLREKKFQARIRACDYERKPIFIVITHRETTDDSVGPGAINFVEDEQAQRIKAEMGLQDVEFITYGQWVG